MTISQSTLQELEEALGTGAASGQNAPNGRNLQGALNQLQRIAQDMQEYGLALSDLPQEKQTQCEEAHEDYQYYRELLANVFAVDLEGADNAIELPDGSTVDLPLQPSKGSGTSTDIPSKP